jgi:hypothetical protein
MDGDYLSIFCLLPDGGDIADELGVQWGLWRGLELPGPAGERQLCKGLGEKIRQMDFLFLRKLADHVQLNSFAF